VTATEKYWQSSSALEKYKELAREYLAQLPAPHGISHQ
jgi:hypothetical protein